MRNKSVLTALGFLLVGVVSPKCSADNLITGNQLMAENGAVYLQATKHPHKPPIAIATRQGSYYFDVKVTLDGTTAFAAYGTAPSTTNPVGGIDVIDLVTKTVTGTIATGRNPGYMWLDDTSRLYVPHLTGVDVFDITIPSSPALAYTIDTAAYGAAIGAALSPDRTTLAVAAGMTVLFFAPGQTSATLKAVTNGMIPFYLVYSLDGTKVFAFLSMPFHWNDQYNTLAVVDAATAQITNVISTGTNFDFMRYGVMAGTRLYTTSVTGFLYSVDPVTETLLDAKFLGGGLEAMAYDAQDGELYVCDPQTSSVRTLSLAGIPTHDRIKASLALPGDVIPWRIAWIPGEYKQKRVK